MNQHEKLCAEMDKIKLRQVDLARLAGVDRRHVWRWQNGLTAVPSYVWTIVRLQGKVRELTVELCK